MSHLGFPTNSEKIAILHLGNPVQSGKDVRQRGGKWGIAYH